MTDHNTQKKIALINDFTGFGRCSITAQLPIISMLKVQCTPLPTAIFSNHTGYPDFFYTDYTDNMKSYMDMWEKLGLQFEGILSGFLGSASQIELVTDFICRFRNEKTVVVVDPVMGDGGKAYTTYTEEMCDKMGSLVSLADIVVPNVTEACILTGTKYKERWTTKELLVMADKIYKMGPDKVVITGIMQKTYVSNLCYEGNDKYSMIRTHKVGESRAGTGDVFSAIIAADAVNGVDFEVSVKKASQFIKKCIMESIRMQIPLPDGVCFEELLSQLK